MCLCLSLGGKKPARLRGVQAVPRNPSGAHLQCGRGRPTGAAAGAVHLQPLHTDHRHAGRPRHIYTLIRISLSIVAVLVITFETMSVGGDAIGKCLFVLVIPLIKWLKVEHEYQH